MGIVVPVRRMIGYRNEREKWGTLRVINRRVKSRKKEDGEIQTLFGTKKPK
jgi:hypothetical protein